jgi:hypothetical protein
MNPVSEDIKDMLVADSSLGLAFATDLFIGREPDSPSNCVTIYDTPSYPIETSLDNVRVHNSHFQIRVRNIGYLAGMTLARNIMDSLQGRAQETWNGTLYSSITAAGEPALLMWDGNNRAIIVFNFNTRRR